MDISTAGVSQGAAAGALQLAMELQQNLQSQVASMGASNPSLATGQSMAAMDAGGVAANMGGGTSGMAIQGLDLYA